MAESRRDGLLTTFAVLFALLALSNFFKAVWPIGSETGFVLFGNRLHGAANTAMASLFGAYQLIFAVAIWLRKRFAMPMAHAYATYVVINVLLFSANNPRPPGIGYLLFGLVYMVVAIGVSVGAAIVLTKRKAELS
jgi:hypothetical protein